jgi:hypothetical protein
LHFLTLAMAAEPPNGIGSTTGGILTHSEGKRKQVLL